MKMNENMFGVLVSYVTHMCNMNLGSVNISRLREIVQECDLTPEVNTRPAATEADVNMLLASMNQPGKKLDAIKAYRQITHVGLKEAKDAVEKYWTIP